MKEKLIIMFTIAFIKIINAQQNFFNVPSSDITPKKHTFFQQQFNFSGDGFQSNTTLNHGLENNFEVGINFIGFDVETIRNVKLLTSDIESPYYPFFMVNAQKRIDINEKLAVSLGVQEGISTTSKVHLGGYYYSNLIFQNEKIGIKSVLGVYYATPSFFGEGKRLFDNEIGIQLGIEKSIIEDKLYFQGDFISGQHDFGELVLGGAYKFTPTWILSAGYQIPTFNSSSIKAVVLEFTYVPKL